MYVCMVVCSVSPRAYLQSHMSIRYQFLVHVTYGCDSVLLLWRLRYDYVYISLFMNDVMFHDVCTVLHTYTYIFYSSNPEQT